jgi:hypothetical protein
VSILIDDEKVHQYIESVDLSFSEDDYVNTVTINFTSELDSATAINLFSTLCNPDTNWGQERITIIINDVEYKFLLERRTTSMKSEGRSFSVWGRSKAATLDTPYSEPIVDQQDADNLWQSGNLMASQIISSVLSGSGVTCDFTIDDFPVYSDNFTVLNMTPIQIINKLVQVPGGRLRSKPDGNLIADYKNYVISANATAVQLFTELDEIVQIDEQIENPIGYNKVEVTGYGSGTNEPNKSLMIELYEDYDCLPVKEPFNIKVYSSPLDLDYTFDTTVGSYSHRGTYTEALTEEIVFNNGKSSVSKPIKSITSTTWIGTNLGSITHERGYNGLLSSISGFGVLSITYVAEYDKYEVIISVEGTGLLYAVEDVISEFDADGNPIEEEV